MSSTSTGSLSAGVQQLYNDGLLPSSLAASTLNGASAEQLSKIAGSTIAGQEVTALLGASTSNTDSASLSSTATNALLQKINPTSNTSSSATTDSLTAAVDNALTSSLNAAVSKFASPTSTTSGSNIDVVG